MLISKLSDLFSKETSSSPDGFYPIDSNIEFGQGAGLFELWKVVHVAVEPAVDVRLG